MTNLSQLRNKCKVLRITLTVVLFHHHLHVLQYFHLYFPTSVTPWTLPPDEYSHTLHTTHQKYEPQYDWYYHLDYHHHLQYLPCKLHLSKGLVDDLSGGITSAVLALPGLWYTNQLSQPTKEEVRWNLVVFSVVYCFQNW